MPWLMSSASKHTKKADTPQKAHQWRSVANRVLNESGDEGKAIRIASAAVKKKKKKKTPLKKK
jgi:hypothetical protein